jgi:hypothetical protein
VLAQADTGWVLHVFKEACNLLTSDVLSLVTPTIGSGPFSIVIPPIHFSNVLKTKDPVVCSADTIQVGPLIVSIRQAAIWNPMPDWDVLRTHKIQLQSRLPLLQRILYDLAPLSSLAVLIVNRPPPDSAIEGTIISIARGLSGEFIAGIKQGHLSCAAEIAGLGGGLTPAGDDWLAGFMLGLWVCLPTAPSITQPLARMAMPLTTDFSAAWLRAAGRGECHHLWHSLFTMLLCDNLPGIREAAISIIRQGHSSGADMLTGFVMALQNF